MGILECYLTVKRKRLTSRGHYLLHLYMGQICLRELNFILVLNGLEMTMKYKGFGVPPFFVPGAMLVPAPVLDGLL